MKDDKSLFEKMKTMSVNELRGFYSTSRTISILLHIAGVSAIFFMLTIPNMFIFILLIIGVYVLAQFAVGIDETKAHIIYLLEKKEKINS